MASSRRGKQRAAGWCQVGARGSMAPSRNEMRQGRRRPRDGRWLWLCEHPQALSSRRVARRARRELQHTGWQQAAAPQRAAEAEAMHAGDCGRGSILARRWDPCGVVSRNTLAARTATRSPRVHLGTVETTARARGARRARAHKALCPRPGAAEAEDSTQQRTQPWRHRFVVPWSRSRRAKRRCSIFALSKSGAPNLPFSKRGRARAPVWSTTHDLRKARLLVD
jgi:hypothetical protein